MLRLVIAAAAAILMFTTTAVRPEEPVSAATPFTDIAGSAFAGDIAWAYDNGITGGCTTTRFCPSSLVTREQMASFIDRMFDFPATALDFFTDDAASQHQAAINRLAAAGVTGGCAAGKYCPRQTVTREQMASFISRAAGLSVGSGRNYFYDDNGRSHESNIDRLAAAGIGSGCGSWRFCPSAAVSREQMAAFLHRVVAPKTPGAYPAPPPPVVAPPPSNSCHPSYTGACLRMGIGDYDCLGGSGNGPNYTGRVRVVGYDEFGLDADHDGIGCETS